MKHALIVSDDAHTRAWVASAIASLDVMFTECSLGELGMRLASEELAFVVADGGHDPEPLVQIVEHAANEGLDAKLFLLVEPDALGSLRMSAALCCDFMVRGGSSDEIIARIRSLVWPGEEATAQELVRVDELTINLATYQAYVDGDPIDFTYLEYALFAFLVTHPNRAYSREVLLRRVWDSDYYGGSRTVDVHIRRVRSKIGGLSRRLETVRNVGYLWHG